MLHGPHPTSPHLAVASITILTNEVFWLTAGQDLLSGERCPATVENESSGLLLPKCLGILLRRHRVLRLASAALLWIASGL